MQIKRFSIVFGLIAAAASTAMAAPARLGNVPAAYAGADVILVQSIREQPLQAVPPVDTGRAPPPSARTGPPPPPPVPPAPRMTTRTAPPAADDDSGPPAREVPPPPTSTSRVAPPPPPQRLQEPTPIHRAAPRRDEPPAIAVPSRRTVPPAYDDPPPSVAAPRRTAPPAYDDPPPRRADAPRRAPSTRSAFATNCTQQCHLSCEASFEACNGDSSPAKPACVKKLESCRTERCACRFD